MKRRNGNARKNAYKEEQERLIKEGIDAERAKIWNFIDRFCNEIKSGARLNGHNRYAPGTVKAWNSFRKLYDLFDRKHRYTWYDVDRAFVTKFLNFMEKKDYMVTAQNKYLVDLRAIISYAYADGMHDNDRAHNISPRRKSRRKTRLSKSTSPKQSFRHCMKCRCQVSRKKCAIYFLSGATPVSA